ncbi:DUF4136 domain-containing protein [Vibrio chagasii]|uniref:DUF4136 domain-containing protein n=1 Tax=Vibrio chagasii TaxID=170679 RepID=UPI00337AE5C2|nr:conserved hypothetical protein [Vibrio chagasii]
MLRKATILLTLTLTACSTIKTDFNNEADFLSYDSFEMESNKETIKSLDEQRIEAALAQQMTQKDLKRVEEQGDLYVQYQLTEESELVSTGSSIGFGYGINNLHGTIAIPKHYEERKYGNLMVELIDTQKKQVVWAAYSNKKLTPTMSTERREALIIDEITKMFEYYPIAQPLTPTN